MIIIGLTGSIGMGKSETARLFQAEGIPVFDADATVHRLYQPTGEATADIARRWPQVVSDTGIDRTKLSRLIQDQPNLLSEIEAIVHPLVRKAQEQFLDQQRSQNTPVVVLDIPLLYETGQTETVDRIVVVSAPESVQRERVLARPGMSERKFRDILSRQWPDDRKRAAADDIVDTSKGLDDARTQVRAILDKLRN